MSHNDNWPSLSKRRYLPAGQFIADIGVVTGMAGILALAARTVAGIARRRTW